MATSSERASSTAVDPAAHVLRARAPVPVAAMVAALWATVTSYLPIVVLMAVGAVGTGGSSGGVMRLATAGWLLGHGVPLQSPADRITLVPLAITVLAAWRLIRAGVHAGRVVGPDHRSMGRPVAAAAGVAITYGFVGAVLAAMSGTPTVAASPVRAGVMLAVFAWMAACVGAVFTSLAGRRWLRRVPMVIKVAVRTGVAAALFVLAAGAIATGIALALAGGDAAEMLGSYRAGVFGQAGITLICLAYAPNVAIWGAAYLLGPGFALGVDTVVSPAEVLLGPVPALPVLAAVPSTPTSGSAAILLGAPLAGAIVAGWMLAWRAQTQWARTGAAPWRHMLVAATVSGPIAGGLVGLASRASAGSLGSGRMTTLGPSDWRVALVSMIVVTVGVVVGAVATRQLTARRQ